MSCLWGCLFIRLKQTKKWHRRGHAGAKVHRNFMTLLLLQHQNQVSSCTPNDVPLVRLPYTGPELLLALTEAVAASFHLP